MRSPLFFPPFLLIAFIPPPTLASSPPPYCNSSCSSLQSLSFPFGTTDGCGLPEFRLNCSHTPPLWWPPGSPFPHYEVLAITNNNISSGTLVVQNTSSVSSSACDALANSSQSYDVSCPETTFGLQFSLHGNIRLLFGCSTSSTGLQANESIYTNFVFSSSNCLDFYSTCNRSYKNLQTVPCFEVIGDGQHGNFLSVNKTYKCEGYTSLYALPTNQSTQPAVQLQWLITQSYYDCKVCEKTNGTCHQNPIDQSFMCSCPNGQNLSTWCPGDFPLDFADRVCKMGICRTSVQFSIGASTIAVAILIVAASFGIYCCCKSKPVKQLKRLPLDSSTDLKLFLADQCGPVLQKTFTYDELLNATNSFSVNKMLGDGGFGTVYEGTLYNGQKVAVKRLYAENARRLEQFLNEIRILSALIDHPNLVKLYGFCCEKQEDLLLVYEFVSNGTLAFHLHGDAGKGLLWETRLSIALETAQALAYLHSCVPPILHRDVKSTNILLDENFHVKVADFGLSRFVPVTATHISTAPQGTPGYVDPEYHHCYQLNDKSDVYSFGVVLVELVSGKTPVDLSRDRMEINLSSLAVAKIQTGALDELIDPYLEVWRYSAVKEMVNRVAELAFQCLALSKDDRPSMKSVVEALVDIKSFGYGVGVRERKLQTSASRDSFDLDETSKLMENCRMPTSPASVEEKWPKSARNSAAGSATNDGNSKLRSFETNDNV